MPRVIFMCGPAGSGKSTVAARLEAAGAVRLSFDTEAWARGFRAMPLAPDVHAQIEADLRAQLRELVLADRDVVLDFSFWSRRMRADYRDLLRPLGVEPETYYVRAPREMLLARVRARQGAHAEDFRLTEELAAFYADGFEEPTADEGPLRVIDGTAEIELI
ncbi:AAA family ATPase [Ruania alba]|uniref:Predicted kinase n=1 Tax=Ruania alba TaxID=648782 RepID=A0A1H5CX45_9MICO|nr:ATP-binding protein [Ruania alba]SED71101.1 Predicted kinase [Ruania alba]